MRLTPAERFWVKVEADPTGCWLWTAAKSKGYGQFKHNGQMVMAYRWSYEHLIGDIPPGLHLDHLCRTPACVNPYHLDPVTPAVNAHRAKGFRPVKSHCPSGHEYTPENTGIDGGYKYCRQCKRASCATYYARKGRPE